MFCCGVPGHVKCEAYYNSHYVSSGGADSAIRLSVQATGARHVIIEPRTVAVPYGHTTQLRCTYENDDDDDDDVYYGSASAAAVSWTWLINGYPLNSTGQYYWYGYTQSLSYYCIGRIGQIVDNRFVSYTKAITAAITSPLSLSPEPATNFRPVRRCGRPMQ